MIMLGKENDLGTVIRSSRKVFISVPAFGSIIRFNYKISFFRCNKKRYTHTHTFELPHLHTNIEKVVPTFVAQNKYERTANLINERINRIYEDFLGCFYKSSSYP